MRRLQVGACLGAVAPWAGAMGGAVAAPASASADIARVEACLAKEKGLAGKRACIGVVATPCQDTPEGASTVGTVECVTREFDVWDGMLNRVYREAVAAFGDDGKLYLKNTQVAWLKFRYQACAWPAHVYPCGTITGPLGADCLLNQTALRALDLSELSQAQKLR